MNIRKMLFIVIPALFILNNAVSFFIFQSGRTVQQSYNFMLDRVLLYKQISEEIQENLRTLNVYAGDRSDIRQNEYVNQKDALMSLRDNLVAQESIQSTHIYIHSYLNMIDTFISQEGEVQKALNSPDLSYAAFYEEAEKTAAFIQDEGHQLVDKELSYYQPFYRQIFIRTEGLYRWGVAIFVWNTLISVVIAYWISLGISRPIKRLTLTAKQISLGNLAVAPPKISANHEFGVLSDAFRRMQENLRVLIMKEKESLEKDRLMKELELKALQNQMNPHFLFNSLNVLSKLALLEGAEKTSDLTVSMSNLLRYNLRKLDRPVTLRDEVEHAKEYFAIQQARFRDRIQFVMEIDEAGLSVVVPTLTLQPILENVFVHGIEGMEAGAEIKLIVTCSQDVVCATISDNGIGMSAEIRESLLRWDEEPLFVQDKGQSTGLGTRNVFKRLELFYGQRDLVEIHSVLGKGTTITIRFPTAGRGEQDVSTTDCR